MAIKINKKNKLVKSYRKWLYLGVLVQFGIPIAYIAVRYKIFEFVDTVDVGWGVKISGWGILILLFLVLAFKKTITSWFEEHKDMFDIKTNRSLFATTMFVIALLLWLASFAIMHAVWLFITLGASSTLANFTFYLKYDKDYADYKKAVEAIKTNTIKNTNNNLKGVSF